MESGERLTAELWAEFGGLQRSDERTRARRSELATDEFQARESEAERMDASTSLGASPWRTCVRWELTSRARNNVRTPNVDGALPPVGHVDELGFDSEKTMMV